MKNINNSINSEIVDPVEPSSVDEITEIVGKDFISRAKELSSKLSNLKDKDMTKSQILSEMSGVFLASRMKASVQIEKVREAAVQNLLDKVSTMSPSMLIRTIEALSTVGESDVSIFSGNGTQKGGVNINMFNSSNTEESSQPSTSNNTSGVKEVKSAASVINAMNMISNTFKTNPSVIEGVIVDEDKK